MLTKDTGTFRISHAGDEHAPRALYQEGVFIGRLETCEVRLDHGSVSRIHAAINFRDGKYVIANLSRSNILSINGRPLGPEKEDVLAGGDTIQIGPYVMNIRLDGSELGIEIQQSVLGDIAAKPAPPPPGMPDAADVLKVFWEKRSREKEDWGTRLRPTEKPRPGKAMFNWRPTGDLRRPWRAGLFLWAFILLAAAGAFAYFRYPQTYAPRPLADPHVRAIDTSDVARKGNDNACTTCHAANEPMENACIRCHSATGFHPTNTRAHADAGVTCVTCHKEHLGADYRPAAAAVVGCAECHNDANTATYNGRKVATPHKGSFGYPAENGTWTWRGVFREVADAIPEIDRSATGDADEQAMRSRHFHTIHTGRLSVPAGLKGDSRGLVSCSTCHNAFKPIDRETPRQTCGACHATQYVDAARDQRFGTQSPSNCISCHTQHPYSVGRWSEFLTDDAMQRRRAAVEAKLRSLDTE